MSQQQDFDMQQRTHFATRLADFASRLANVEEKASADSAVANTFASKGSEEIHYPFISLPLLTLFFLLYCEGYHTEENLDILKFCKDQKLSLEKLRETFAVRRSPSHA